MCPAAGRSAVEVIGGGQALSAGRLDETPESFEDDQAANNALTHIGREGLFDREREAAFDFAWHWDTLAEMHAYFAEKWTQTQIPEDELEEARRLTASARDRILDRDRCCVRAVELIHTHLSSPGGLPFMGRLNLHLGCHYALIFRGH